MQRLEIEHEVQLTDILKECVEGLDIDLDEVEQRQWGFGGGADEDKVESRVVAVSDEGGRVGVLGSLAAGGSSSRGAGEEGGKTGIAW